MKKFFDKVPLFFCFLIAAAFSVKNLREPDLWWQIRTGDWILEHKQIPTTDVFSYTYAGTTWINIKWGFEVVAALITKAAGPECVLLLQALVSCLIVFFLIKLSRAINLSKAVTTIESPWAVVLSLLLTLIAIEYRINGRPEMISHLFTVVFLFMLLRHRQQTSNKILWLIPLQLVWANFHEAFGIGIVVTAIFFVGSWLEYWLAKRNVLTLKTELPKTISIVLIATIAVVAINPVGFKLLARPFNILGQVYENKFTTELAGFSSPEYWQWNVYWAIGLLVIGLLGTLVCFRTLKTKQNRFKLFTERIGISYLLTLIAFFYLAATAYRNIVFLLLVFFPLLVFGINSLANKIPSVQKLYKPILTGFCVLEIALYALIVSDKYYQFTKSHDHFGLEVVSTINPIGAAEFVKENHLEGKCFSDYLTSSYLLWRLQPGFKTFIDLRDLDIFPASFFSTFAEAVTYPDSFDQLDSVNHFDYVVLYRPQFAGLHEHLFNQSRFKLAFVDAVAAVYVKKNSAADSSTVVNFTRSNGTSHHLANAVNYLLNPMFGYTSHIKPDYDLIAAEYYIHVNKLDEAEKLAIKASANNIDNAKGCEMLGEVYYNKALKSGVKEVKDNNLELAKKMYVQSANLNSNFSPAYIGMGAVLFQQQNMLGALDNFEKAIALDRSNLNAYLFAAGCCNYFINQNSAESNTYAEKAISFYSKADKLNPDNPQIALNQGFLYFRLNDCNNCAKYLKNIVDFPGLSAQQRQQVKECINRCGK
ncbi:MAG: hypothetical protein JWO06_2591 [Bacteroidota bacterium]|nr:hypothetical protein [Bacteroidota bacterium]